ncbi:MAG: GTP-sensing pleiotropic transcriptional regulator CodY, partial [Synergistaceae bacterium]|nr:GTP-sensing pleiotropic transcriptional regulator CodY [Synergistaceae bacterium]
MAVETAGQKKGTSDMEDLLEKTRVVSRVLQSRVGNRSPDYQRLARLLTDLSSANVYIINKEGRILGYSWINEYDCP